MVEKDPFGLLARTLEQTGTLVANVRPDQAHLPTPCTEWDVRTLVNHIVFDLNLFESMVNDAQRPTPGANLIGDDWPAAYRAASAALLSAWRRRGAESTMKLMNNDIPASWAIGQHMADLACHGWDLARATGQSTDLDPEIGQSSLEWAQGALKPELRGNAFKPEVPAPANSPTYDRLAAFFGRDPTWSPQSSAHLGPSGASSTA
jgi:uncharacterized protein (TIGR03086 family)